MSPDPTPDAPEVPIKRWLDRQVLSGGIAAVLPIALPLASGVLLLVQAGLIAHILHQAIVVHAGVGALAVPLAALGGVLLLRIVLGASGDVAATVAAERIKLCLRDTMGAQMLAKPTTWTAARSSGALTTVFVEQVDALEGYFTKYLPAMIQASILPLAFAAVLFPIDWMVGLILLLTTPLIPLFMALAGWGAKAATAQQAAALGRLGGRFADRLRGLTTLRLFGREAAETAGVAAASEELRRRTMRVMRIAFLSSAVLEFFAALGVAGVALYVGLTFLGLVGIRGGVPLTFEAGMFCLLMAPEVYAPLRLLAAHFHDGAAAKAAAAEIAAQLGGLPAAVAPTAAPIDAKGWKSGPAALVLDGVGVTAPNGLSLIADVSFALQPGRSLAVLGASGIGKSTLLEAIARLREHSGAIRLDGERMGEIPEPKLRARVAVLGQRPRIFAGSIADNIRLGRRDACETAVQLAARRALVGEFADPLPDGLDTMLGEDGLGLSGGEIQRIALARLYLRDPGLVLLDEPTAHLDAATEALVLDGIMEFARGRTLIVATHSSAVAARMDRAMRIAGGRLLPALHPSMQHETERGAA